MSVVSLALIILPIFNSGLEIFISIGIILLGLPVYLIFIHWKKHLPKCIFTFFGIYHYFLLYFF